MNLKKGTQVKILSGKDRGKTGEILEINRKLEKVKVKSINMIKRHTNQQKKIKVALFQKKVLYTNLILKILIQKKDKKIVGKK